MLVCVSHCVKCLECRVNKIVLRSEFNRRDSQIISLPLQSGYRFTILIAAINFARIHQKGIFSQEMTLGPYLEWWKQENEDKQGHPMKKNTTLAKSVVPVCGGETGRSCKSCKIWLPQRFMLLLFFSLEKSYRCFFMYERHSSNAHPNKILGLCGNLENT